MTVNLSYISPSNIPNPTKTLTVGSNPYSIALWYNPADSTKSIVATADYSSSGVSLHVIDFQNIGTGNISSPTKTLIVGSVPYSVALWYNPVDSTKSIVATADSGSGRVSLHVIDFQNIGTGSISSPTKTLTVGSNPYSVALWYNPSDSTKSIIATADSGSSRVSLHVIDFQNIGTGNVSTPTKTLTVGSNPYSVALWYNPVDSTKSIIATADAGSSRVSLHVIDFQNIGTGNVSTPTKTLTVGSVPYSVALWYNPVDSTKSIVGTVDNGSNRVSLHVIDFQNIGTGNISSPTKTLTTGVTPYSLSIWYNPVDSTKSIVATADTGSSKVSLYVIDFQNIGTGNISSPTKTLTVGSNPASVDFWYNPTDSTKSIIATADFSSSRASLHLPFNLTTPAQVVPSSINIFASGVDIQSGNILISSEITFFTLIINCTLRGDAINIFLGKASFLQTGDSEITLNQPLAFSGSTAAITGFYRVTMGVSQSVTLGSKSTYNDSITIPGTGILLLTQSTAITDDFILQSGCTVNKAAGVSGSVTLTIPYVNPGLIVGTGVTISAPTATFSAPNINVGSNGETFSRVRCRLSQYFTFDFSTVSTSGNTITIADNAMPVGTQIMFMGEDLPQPLDRRAFYYVVTAGDSFQISATPGGAVLDLTDTGTGTRSLWGTYELANTVVTSGGFSSSLSGVNEGDQVLFQAIHLSDSSVGGVDPNEAIASKYFETTLQRNGLVVSTLERLEIDEVHNAFASASGVDGYSIRAEEFTVDPSNPALVQIDIDDPDAQTTTDRAYLFYVYVQHTQLGIRVFRGYLVAENANTIKVLGELTVENVNLSARLTVGGALIYRADGKSWVATTGGTITHQPVGTRAVIGQVEIPFAFPVSESSKIAAILAMAQRLLLQDPSGTVTSIAANAITADALATSAVAEIQSGLATSTQVTTAQTNVQSSISALNNLSQAQAQTAATAALNAYDPPTKAELDSAVDALPTATENATAVRSELATELAQIDSTLDQATIAAQNTQS